MIAKIRNLFLTGLLVSLPIIITIYIVTWVVSFFDNLIIVQLLPKNIANIPAVGVVFSVLVMFAIGLVAKNFLGKYFIKLLQAILNRIPLVKTIYSTVKQILDTVFSNNSRAFKDAVLVEYPRKDCWMIGFVTSTVDPTHEVKQKIGIPNDVVSIFIPTTPNPTSGFLIFVAKADIKPLDIKPDEAMKLIISGGVINKPATEAENGN